ncbi:MAG TPA: hypothetical protein VGM74_05585 [Burkholderiaceae bacterium]
MNETLSDASAALRAVSPPLLTITGDVPHARVFALELCNTATGAGVLVVHEKNDRPLDAHSGPLALVSSSDLRLGPRHLRRLCEIKVIRLPA